MIRRRPPPLDAAAIVRRARRLRFRVRPGAVSQLAGAYHGARPGIGLTFAELRAYEPGDDVRHLDWNVTARQGRPFVRRFVEERALSLWLVVDVSASMRFGPERTTKADRAAQAAALLATAAIQNGDRAGLILVSDRIELELAPAGGVRHLSQLVRALVATPTTSPKTKLSVGLARVRRTARRAMLVVISDFVTEEPVGSWRRAARRHDTIALRVVDPREEKLPDAGLLALEDAEGGQTSHGRFELGRVRRRYERAAARAVASVPALVRQLGNPGLHHDDRRRSDRTSDRALLETGDASRWSVNPVSARGLVPPRPNLGPESWSEPPPVAIAVIVAAALGGLFTRLAILEMAPQEEVRIRRAIKPPSSHDATPQGRLVACSHSIRETLANQFGTAWRAKTTEELADEAPLLEVLGHDAAPGADSLPRPGRSAQVRAGTFQQSPRIARERAGDLGAPARRPLARRSRPNLNDDKSPRRLIPGLRIRLPRATLSGLRSRSRNNEFTFL